VIALSPVDVGPLTLRNRFVKTATFEGMSPAGRVTAALVEHHAAMARRGVALTTVAYGAVEPRGRTFADQLLVDADAGLDRVADAVHAEGGAAALQLAHCGGFSKLRAKRPPGGPSAGWNPYGLAYGVPRVRAMGDDDLDRVLAAYARAAVVTRDPGFDALELHCGHGYLLSQFLSPIFNRRSDRWGGDLEARLRFPLAVVAAVRAAVGDDVALLAKINLEDGVPGGSTLDDAVAIARALEAAGVHGLVPSGGLVQRSAFFLMRGDVPIAEMAAAEASPLQSVALRAFAPFLVKAWPYTSGFFFAAADRVRAAVSIPVGLLGGVDSTEQVRRALDAGFAFVVMGRALLADPDFVERAAAGEQVTSRCTHCNRCVAEMDRDGVRCVL